MNAVSHWLDRLASLLPTDFVEHVTIEATAALIAAGVVAFVGIFASWHIWRTIRCHLRALAIRKTASDFFIIIRCPIINDDSGSIGNEISIRLETAFRAFAGWNQTSERPFHVMTLPAILPDDEGTEEHDKAIETAKRWLANTDGDILIWGKHIKGESIGFIRLLGKNRNTGTIEARRIDFDKHAKQFDEALAIAIAHEAAQMTQATLAMPEAAKLDALRTASAKMRKLATIRAPALSDRWREEIASDHRRFLAEIIRRAPGTQERLELEELARAELATLDKGKESGRYAETALQVAILTRKRNWLDPNIAELEDAKCLLDEVIALSDSSDRRNRSAEGALEKLLIRRIECFLAQKARPRSDPRYVELFSEARHLVNNSTDQRLYFRLVAASRWSPFANEFPNFELKHTDAPRLLRDAIQLIPHLDNAECLDFAYYLSCEAIEIGDQTEDADWWRASSAIIEAAMASRDTWIADELRYLEVLHFRSLR